MRPSALRFYERKGLLASPSRLGGRRCYGEEALRRIAFIRCAQESGLTLQEIEQMIRAAKAGATPQRLWRAVRHKATVIERKIDALRASQFALKRKLRRRCQTLADCERALARSEPKG